MKKHSMKVGFYDEQEQRMTDVEPWPEPIENARAAAVMMGSLYASGEHRLPSPIWCVWGAKKKLNSIFVLDGKPRSSRFHNKVKALMV
jgi:hypothetical protein